MEIRTYCKLENDKGLENFNLTFVGNGPKPGPAFPGLSWVVQIYNSFNNRI